jgi:hypothetical protein
VSNSTMYRLGATVFSPARAKGTAASAMRVRRRTIVGVTVWYGMTGRAKWCYQKSVVSVKERVCVCVVPYAQRKSQVEAVVSIRWRLSIVGWMLDARCRRRPLRRTRMSEEGENEGEKVRWGGMRDEE